MRDFENIDGLSVRAYLITAPDKYFVPDAIDGQIAYVDNSMYDKDVYEFPNSVITDIKYTTTGRISLKPEFNDDQIVGFIDFLSEVGGVTLNGRPTGRKAADYGAAKLVLVTPWDVVISKDIINYAKSKNVAVSQRFTVDTDTNMGLTNPNDITLKVTQSIHLYKPKSLVPSLDPDRKLFGDDDFDGKAVNVNWEKL